MATRDFREATLTEIRNNLVDEDPDWGIKWDAGIFFKKNNELKSDLSNFDDYMRRRIELNEITLQRFNEIVENVHSVEELYRGMLMSLEQEAHALERILSKLNSEISREDFEKSFDASSQKNQLLDLFPTQVIILDPSFFKDEESFKRYLENISSKDLSNVTLENMSAGQRKIFYQEIYARLAKDGISNRNTQFLENKLSEMSMEDAMALVYNDDKLRTNPPGTFGGSQMYRNMSKAEKKRLKEFLEKKYGISSDQSEELLVLFQNSGCAYVAIVNGIFAQYMGNPRGFEQAFGFPLYNKDGNLNFGLLFADYCYTVYSDDIINGVNFRGADVDRAKKYSESYLSDKDIPFSLDTRYMKDISADSFVDEIKSYIGKENTTIYLCIFPCVMYDKKGKQTGDFNEGSGHAVSVVGVNDNGDLTVSSWGDIYTVKKEDLPNYDTVYYSVGAFGDA